MKIYFPVLATMILLTTLPMSLGTDVTRQQVVNSETLRLRRTLADVPASTVNGNIVGGLNVAAESEGNNNVQAEEEEEEGDEAAQGESAKVDTTEGKPAKNEPLKTTAPSKMPVSSTLSIDVAKVKKTWRGITETDEVSARKISFNPLVQNTDKERMNEHNTVHIKEEEEVEEMAQDAGTKIETTNNEPMTSSTIAVSNTSSINVVDPQSTSRNDMKGKETSVSNSLAPNFDDENQNENNNSQAKEEDELDETAKDEESKERTVEEGRLTAATSSTIAVSNTSLINVIDSQGTLRDVTKGEEESARKVGSSSAAESLDVGNQGKNNIFQANEVNELGKTHEESKEEALEEEMAGNEHLASAASSTIAVSNTSSVNVVDSQTTVGDDLTSALTPLATTPLTPQATNGVEAEKLDDEANHDGDNSVLSTAGSGAESEEEKEEENEAPKDPSSEEEKEEENEAPKGPSSEDVSSEEEAHRSEDENDSSDE